MLIPIELDDTAEPLAQLDDLLRSGSVDEPRRIRTSDLRRIRSRSTWLSFEAKGPAGSLLLEFHLDRQLGLLTTRSPTESGRVAAFASTAGAWFFRESGLFRIDNPSRPAVDGDALARSASRLLEQSWQEVKGTAAARLRYGRGEQAATETLLLNEQGGVFQISGDPRSPTAEEFSPVDLLAQVSWLMLSRLDEG